MARSKFTECDITSPIEGRVIIKNRWWACVDGNPKRALFYGESPQCNSNKTIAEHTGEAKTIPDVRIVFVEIGYIPQRSED